MDMNGTTFESADAWRQAAMARPDGVTAEEASQRRQLAELHNSTNAISDPDTLLDQQLYILGKMDLEEYQAYLVFKHGRK